MTTPSIVTNSLSPVAGTIASLTRPEVFRIAVEDQTDGLDVDTLILKITDSYGIEQELLSGGSSTITEIEGIEGFSFIWRDTDKRLDIAFDFPSEDLIKNGMLYTWSLEIDDKVASTLTETWENLLWIGDFEEADHAEDGLNNLLSQYQGKPRIEAFLTAFLDQLTSLENLTAEVITRRSLLTAENSRLDTLGKLAVYSRGDFTEDEEYRFFLSGKIFVDGADGLRSDFVELMTNVLYSTTAELNDYWPCVIKFYADNINYPEATFRLLKRLTPAGVRLDFAFTDTLESNAFQTGGVLGSNETSVTASFKYWENTPSADTITRSTGNFITEGFLAGDTIEVSGTVSNNGSYTISSVGTTTITLINSDDLIAEGYVSSTIVCTSRGLSDNSGSGGGRVAGGYVLVGGEA